MTGSFEHYIEIEDLTTTDYLVELEITIEYTAYKGCPATYTEPEEFATVEFDKMYLTDTKQEIDIDSLDSGFIESLIEDQLERLENGYDPRDDFEDER